MKILFDNNAKGFRKFSKLLFYLRSKGINYEVEKTVMGNIVVEI